MCLCVWKCGSVGVVAVWQCGSVGGDEWGRDGAGPVCRARRGFTKRFLEGQSRKYKTLMERLNDEKKQEGTKIKREIARKKNPKRSCNVRGCRVWSVALRLLKLQVHGCCGSEEMENGRWLQEND